MNTIQKKEQEDTYYINEPNIVAKVLLRGIIKGGFRLVLNLRSNKSSDIDNLEGSTILLGNHVSAIDPFVMGAFVTKKWVHYLTSSSYFEYPILKKILKYFGAIPKRQGMSDIRSTKMAINVLKRNGTIGLFPEGARTIDGSMLPFNNSAAKLIKQSNSNVVISHLDGASISLPRWYRGCSRGFRRGRIDHKSFVLFTNQQVRSMSIDDIDSKIRIALSYNEYEWQRRKRIKFHSRSMAEGMHAILHKCPKCLQDFSMNTKKNLLYCTDCDNTAVIDRYGLINSKSEDDIVYQDMIAWRKWQNTYLAEEVQKDDFKMEFEGSLSVKDSYGKVIKIYPQCKLTVTKESVSYVCNDNNIILPFKSIADAVCDYSLRFEINQEHNSYQFTPVNGQTVIKISDAIKYIKGILE